MRQEWDRYFLDICIGIATRSTCTRRKCGAVLVKNKLIVSTGFNGTPRGMKHCNELYPQTVCMRATLNVDSGTNLEFCRACHAEYNAIIHAGLNNVSSSGGTLYTTYSPCTTCAKIII